MAINARKKLMRMTSGMPLLNAINFSGGQEDESYSQVSQFVLTENGWRAPSLTRQSSCTTSGLHSDVMCVSNT